MLGMGLAASGLASAAKGFLTGKVKEWRETIKKHREEKKAEKEAKKADTGGNGTPIPGGAPNSSGVADFMKKSWNGIPYWMLAAAGFLFLTPQGKKLIAPKKTYRRRAPKPKTIVRYRTRKPAKRRR